jgi:hypothetical protein
MACRFTLLQSQVAIGCPVVGRVNECGTGSKGASCATPAEFSLGQGAESALEDGSYCRSDIGGIEVGHRTFAPLAGDQLSRCLEIASARRVVDLQVPRPVQERIDTLAERANEALINAADFISILKLKARRHLDSNIQ